MLMELLVTDIAIFVIIIIVTLIIMYMQTTI